MVRRFVGSGLVPRCGRIERFDWLKLCAYFESRWCVSRDGAEVYGSDNNVENISNLGGPRLYKLCQEVYMGTART